MTITIRLRPIVTPPRPTITEVTELSDGYTFATLVQVVDEAIADNDDFIVRTALGANKTVDPSQYHAIAIREEF